MTDNKIDSGVITRTILAILTIYNKIAIAYGWFYLDLGDIDLSELVANILLILTSVWIWWKNNPITKDAKLGQEVINGLKVGDIRPVEVEDLIETSEMDMESELYELGIKSEPLYIDDKIISDNLVNIVFPDNTLKLYTLSELKDINESHEWDDMKLIKVDAPYTTYRLDYN